LSGSLFSNCINSIFVLYDADSLSDPIQFWCNNCSMLCTLVILNGLISRMHYESSLAYLLIVVIWRIIFVFFFCWRLNCRVCKFAPSSWSYFCTTTWWYQWHSLEHNSFVGQANNAICVFVNWIISLGFHYLGLSVALLWLLTVVTTQPCN
jgi:hypothetical protein